MGRLRRSGWIATAGLVALIGGCSSPPPSSAPSPRGAGGIGGAGGSTAASSGTGGAAVAGGGGSSGQAGQAGSLGAAAGGAGGANAEGGTGGGTADPGKDAGATGSCAGLFCEDFERGSIDPAIWDVKVNGGQPTPSLVTQAGLVAHGKYAAHFHVNPNTESYGFIITKNPPAALRGHHYGRAYFMVAPMPPTNHTEYIFAGSTGFPQLKYLEVASAAPLVWQLTYVDLVPPGTGENYHSGGKLPIGKWFCLEWEFNDTPDQAAVYLDGASTADFAQNSFSFDGSSSGLVGGFAAFGFGFYAWHPATYAFDVYYDDIVLDTKRVGCL